MDGVADYIGGALFAFRSSWHSYTLMLSGKLRKRVCIAMVTDDLEPFESPKILIDGAKESISEFDSGCQSFVSACEYLVIDYDEPSSGDKVRKFRFKQRIPGSLRLGAHRILNDLRHALDQAVCDGAILLGRKDGRGLHFPFGKSLIDFENEANARLKGVHAGLVAFIKGHNSYYGGDTELYAFGSLSGPNKHQRILRISRSNTGIELWQTPQGVHIEGPVRMGGNKWSELRNELEVLRIVKGGSMQGNIDIRPVLEIVLGEGEAPLSGPASTVFGTLAGKIERIVFGIEAETIRIRASGAP